MDIKTLIENFSLFDNWEDRYEYLIGLGRLLPKMPDELKTDANMVKGCISNVWISLSINDGKVVMSADSDALIVKGLVYIIYISINNKEISGLSNVLLEDNFKELGLDEHLTPNRRNGFYSMVGKINEFIKASI